MAVDENVLACVVETLFKEVVAEVTAILVVLCKLEIVVLPALMAELSIDHQDGDAVASASLRSGSLTSPVSGLMYHLGLCSNCQGADVDRRHFAHSP
jgi:hypothetical protein